MEKYKVQRYREITINMGEVIIEAEDSHEAIRLAEQMTLDQFTKDGCNPDISSEIEAFEAMTKFGFESDTDNVYQFCSVDPVEEGETNANQ